MCASGASRAQAADPGEMIAMDAHDLARTMKRTPDFADEQGLARFWMLGPCNGGMAWVGRFSGASPWERHPDGDEVLHVLEGEVQVVLLGESGTVRTRLQAGQVFIVPRNTWHQQEARGTVVQWGATPGRTEHSDRENPLRAVDP